jgi:hypothetical protein
MDWDDYLRTKRPIIGNLPKQPKAPLIKQEYLELTARFHFFGGSIGESSARTPMMPMIRLIVEEYSLRFHIASFAKCWAMGNRPIAKSLRTRLLAQTQGDCRVCLAVTPLNYIGMRRLEADIRNSRLLIIGFQGRPWGGGVALAADGAGPFALGGVEASTGKQLMVPMVLAPYCTYPLAVGVECCAVNGK